MGYDQLPYIACYYNVACQFFTNAIARWADHWPELLKVLEIIIPLINKMHVYGHKLQCLYGLNPCYIEWQGRTHGEGIETTWAKLNLFMKSLREMGGPNRHDTLNDICNAYNLDKVRTLGKQLYLFTLLLEGTEMCVATKLKDNLSEAREVAPVKRANWEALTQNAKPELVREWLKMPTTVSIDSKGNVHSVYKAKTSSCELPFIINESPLLR